MECRHPLLHRKPKSAPSLSSSQIHLISRALSDPRRFEIFERIANQSNIACADLREYLPITAPTLSHHLKELETAGLIESTRDGKFMNLSVRRDIWQAYLAELHKI